MSMGQKFGTIIAEWLELQVVHDIKVKLSRGAAVSSEGLTEGRASKLHSWGCWWVSIILGLLDRSLSSLLAVEGDSMSPSVSCHLGLCLGKLTTW